MKKIYNEVEIQVLLLSTEDIVTLSQNAKDDLADDIFGND